MRLAVELGLHHNPLSQPHVFSEPEAQLRIRLWSIVLLHDRGTSILLGRPLAIAPSDSDTPQPPRSPDVSEHFVFSAPIVDIQADIINSLYSPTRQSADTIMRHAARIMKSMSSFKSRLPDSYKKFFSNMSWVRVPGTSIRLQKHAVDGGKAAEGQDWHWTVMLKKRGRSAVVKRCSYFALMDFSL